MGDDTLPITDKLIADNVMAEVHNSLICTIYPLYIDSTKSVSKGRKLPIDVCVAQPTIREIGDVLHRMKIEFRYENDHRHPADPLNFGRVRVFLKNADGSLINRDLPDKKAVMLALVERIPTLRAEEQRKLLENQKTQVQKKKR